ncbi:PepSY domain-containing protein [Methylobacterium sp. WSM2598]|uniref:PepSY domain-containing protein n=1 Tax=Methylobacterium sp. WSM2598 TaxID=398261 RepID=UPI000372EE07|nr:PepSY domain-containing protein [Methylobacterium sp. WSM2598]
MRRVLVPALLVLAVPFIAAAAADTPVPPEQAAKVEALLRQQGFTTWKEIELDDGMIEVEDAVDASGKKFDLKLDPVTLEIRSRKAE